MFKKTASICAISFIVTLTLGCKPTYVDTIPKPPKTKVANQRLTTNQAISKYAKKYNVDEKTIHAIVITESNYNHKAVSRAGAQGLMQIMPKTGKAHDCGNLFDPEKNIACGTRHYAGMLARYNGDETRALASYNLGGSRVKNGQPVPKAGLAYANKVINNKKKVILY